MSMICCFLVIRNVRTFLLLMLKQPKLMVCGILQRQTFQFLILGGKYLEDMLCDLVIYLIIACKLEAGN